VLAKIQNIKYLGKKQKKDEPLLFKKPLQAENRLGYLNLHNIDELG